MVKKKQMFYRGRLTNPRRQGVGEPEIPDEELPGLLEIARADLEAKMRARKVGIGRPRSTRTKERPYTATQVKIESRKKHNCYARVKHFLELLFDELGRPEEREDRPTLRQAQIEAGIANYHAARRIYWRHHAVNNFKLRSPEEPKPQRLKAYRKLDYYRQWLLDRLYEWRFDNLEKRCIKIRDARLYLRDKEENIKRG